MKFRRWFIITLFAISQVAMVLPASAEDAVQNTNAGQTVTDQSIKGAVQSGDQTGDPGVNGAGGTEGTNVPGEGQTGTSGTGDAVTPPPADFTGGQVTTSGSKPGQLILMMNSNKMYQNGKEYRASYPMEVKNGVSYVSIRAIVERCGFKLTFDNNTKETIIKRGSDELRFKLNTTGYKVNGVARTMRGKSYSAKNNFMVPLTAITNALNITYTYDSVGKRVIVNLVTTPVASFTISNTEIVAGETQVQYVTKSSSPNGLPIVNEEWTGREDIFETPGTYVVTYRVQDSSGQWSNPFSLTVNVVKPHTPPVADFKTDKDTYKMGELITYTDLSTDEVGIKDRVWENKQPAFFTPGQTTIRLKVVNQFGLSSTVEKTITITNETLYSQDDFNKLFMPVGEKYLFDGSQVPTWAKANYSITSEPVTLIRSNSPETVYSEGLLYHETAIGNTRIMVHHANSTTKSVKVYVIATNNNSETTRLTQTNLGMGGPNSIATATGEKSVKRYFESMQLGNKYKDTWIAPGESKIILNELSTTAMKPGDVVSLYADLYSDHTLQYNVVMVDSAKDPVKALPYLTPLTPDIHNRGTYMEANRNIEYSDLIGNTPIRLLIGDNSSDPYLIGSDGVTHEDRMNAGNFGVLYRIKLYRVAPNTLITFNPRGGYYSGPIMVNGDIVGMPNNGGLNSPSESAVLYRTEDREQTVEFLFTAAPGSNLSVNLLFQQMPEKK